MFLVSRIVRDFVVETTTPTEGESFSFIQRGFCGLERFHCMDTQQHRFILAAPSLPQSAQLTVKDHMDQFRALMHHNDDNGGGRSRDQEPTADSAGINLGSAADTDTEGNANEPFGKRRKLAERLGSDGVAGSSLLTPSGDSNMGAGVSTSSWASHGMTIPTALHQLSGVQGNVPAQVLNLHAQQQQTQQEFKPAQGRTTSGSSGVGPTPLAATDSSLGMQGLGTGSNFGTDGDHNNSNAVARAVPETSTATLQQLLMQNQAMLAAATAAGMSNIPFGNTVVAHSASGPGNSMPLAGGGSMLFPHANQQMMFQNQLAAYGMMPQGMGLPIQFLQQHSGNLIVPPGMLPQPSALGIGQLGGNAPSMGLSMAGEKAQDATQPNLNIGETTGAAAASADVSKMTGRRPLHLFMSCDEESLSEYQCLVRKQIQLFEARSEDVESNAKGRNKPIVLGQVGIRCRHCSVLAPKSRSRGATYYPAKLNGLYQAAQSMASGHLCYHCQHIPPDIRQELLILRERKSSAGGGKKYWGDGVRILGVIEDESGLRFKR